MRRARALGRRASISSSRLHLVAAPIAAAGKLYLASEGGTVTVVRAGAQWEVLAASVLDEECYATPALADGRIYLRTSGSLHCFSR